MSFEPFNWSCPYCQSKQVVVETNYDEKKVVFYLQQEPTERRGLRVISILCANAECGEIMLLAWLHGVKPSHNYNDVVDTDSSPMQSFRLLPDSFAKPQPQYIPAVIVEDYYEACKIRDLSPKASATLSRRCLQGMIRDFCGISKARLFDEISALRKSIEDGTAPRAVTPESVDAIDSVRSVGNIGAHMEKDINVIVDVDPEEAQVLIELIESLFDEWYVAQHKRQLRFEKVGNVAAQKKQQIEDARAQKADTDIDGAEP